MPHNTELWLLVMVVRIQEGNFALAVVPTDWLMPKMHSAPAADLLTHSSDRFVAKKKRRSFVLPSAVVVDLGFGSSVQHIVVQLLLETVAHLEGYSQQG